MPTKRGAPRWALDSSGDSETFESTENRTRQCGDKSFAIGCQPRCRSFGSVCYLFNPARSNSCVFRLSKERSALTKYGEPGLRTGQRERERETDTMDGHDGLSYVPTKQEATLSRNNDFVPQPFLYRCPGPPRNHAIDNRFAARTLSGTRHPNYSERVEWR